MMLCFDDFHFLEIIILGTFKAFVIIQKSGIFQLSQMTLYLPTIHLIVISVGSN